MLITLAKFKEGEPKQVQEELNAKKMDVEFVDLKYIKPLHLDGTVEKGQDSLSFRGQIRSEIEQTCGRCLKTLQTDVARPFELFYETKGLLEVDTTDDLREALIIEHPISFVCSEDCRGLCPKCGINLNELNCRCDKSDAKPLSSSIKRIMESRRQKEKNHGTS